MSTEPAKNDSVSVERLDSSVGYTKENTVLVCNAVNRMKSDFEVDDFVYFCKKNFGKFYFRQRNLPVNARKLRK